jgi:adenosylcobyric acid synthase
LVDGAAEGGVSADGRVHGTYLHGLFTSDALRRAFLARLGIDASGEQYRPRIESVLDALADHIEQHLDVDGLLALAR